MEKKSLAQMIGDFIFNDLEGAILWSRVVVAARKFRYCILLEITL
jgi:hypothetical protein